MQKKYVIIYRSQEHHEVLGYVTAPNMKGAVVKAQKELKDEAKFYETAEATIGELKNEKKITFEIE